MYKRIIFLCFITILFGAGCASVKLHVTPEGDYNDGSNIVEQKDQSQKKISQVHIKNGDVYIADEEGQSTLVAEQKKEVDGDVSSHFSQYRYSKAEFSPDKKFVAMLADGWESVYVKIYSVADRKTYDVVGKDINPINFEWTEDNKLSGSYCEFSGSFCGESGEYLSESDVSPWIIK